MPTTVRAGSDISVPTPPTNHQTRVGASPSSPNDISLRHAALVAGLGLLVLAVLAPIANFGILQKLIVPGDAQTTAQNIVAAQGLFRLAIGALFAVAILDVVVAWALYFVFRPVNQSLSLLAALCRVVYASLFAVAVSNLLSALQLLGGADFLKAFATDQLHAQMMVLLGAFQSGWDLALIIFGLHLCILGTLVVRSGKRLWLLGILVIAAGLGYIVDGGGKSLLPNDTMTVSTFTFVGEALLIFWLLWKGIRGDQTERAKAS